MSLSKNPPEKKRTSLSRQRSDCDDCDVVYLTIFPSPARVCCVCVFCSDSCQDSRAELWWTICNMEKKSKKSASRANSGLKRIKNFQWKFSSIYSSLTSSNIWSTWNTFSLRRLIVYGIIVPMDRHPDERLCCPTWKSKELCLRGQMWGGINLLCCSPN